MTKAKVYRDLALLGDRISPVIRVPEHSCDIVAYS